MPVMYYLLIPLKLAVPNHKNAPLATIYIKELGIIPLGTVD
jgi:hypothetical protein